MRVVCFVFVFKQKTAYEMRISDWSSDVCSSDLVADVDLAGYPDKSFDYAILSQTLQTARNPHLVLDQLLRIGERAFVSFPNFAHWRVRASLLWGGRMPVTNVLPERWYDTPNIHHVTIDDFRALLKERDIAVERAWFLSRGRQIGSATV